MTTASAERGRLYVFYGGDGFSAREELRALRARIDIQGNLALNTVRFDATGAEAVDVDEVIAACHTASLFAEPRLVIVEGLLARFGGGRRRGGRGRGAPSTDQAEKLIGALSSLPATTTAVILEQDERTAGPLIEALRGNAELKEFPLLSPTGVRAWAARRLESLGARATPAALSRLTDLIDGHHLADLAAEIDKLACYAVGRTIEERDVDALVSAAREYETWDLTDAVIGGRTQRAMGVLREMEEREFPGQVLFSMLVRQFRQLMLVQGLKREGLPDAQIARRIGVRYPFPMSKLADQAGRWPPTRLEQTYRRLLRTDVAVKTGVMDIDTALEVLILEVAGPTR